MTGFCYPEMMVSIFKAFAERQIERAFDLFDAYLPLVRYEQQVGIGLAVRKYVLAKRGVIASAKQRKPDVGLSRADIADIERLLLRQSRRVSELS
jgi:4-hydroxy-tetrahydrodipicolinate synthase